MAHGDARKGKWRGNWRMEWVASTLYTTSEHGISSITTADAHTSAARSRLNWCPCRFKWTRPLRRKTKYGFCACVITFQTQSTTHVTAEVMAYCAWDQARRAVFGMRAPDFRSCFSGRWHNSDTRPNTWYFRDEVLTGFHCSCVAPVVAGTLWRLGDGLLNTNRTGFCTGVAVPLQLQQFQVWCIFHDSLTH
jgi:hypothetical protein